MANESLVMTASVRDDFSSTLRKLQNDLKSLSTTGAASTKTLQKDWKGVGSEIQAASGSITRDMLPAMRLGNLAGLALGGAIGGAAVALKNFAQNTMTLGNFSKEIGLASREVAKLQAMGGFFGIDPSTTQENFRTFQTFLQAMKKDGGETISHLRQVFGSAGDQLAGALLKPGTFREKMELAFQAIRNVDSEPTARKMAQELFGNEAWATAIRNMTPELQAAFAKIASKIDENKDAATRFNVALLEWKITVQNLTESAFGPLLKVTTELMDKWKNPIENKFKEFAADIGVALTALEKLASGEYLEGLKQIGEILWKAHPLSKLFPLDGPRTETPGSAAITRGMNAQFGKPGASAPGSPAKDIPKTNDELRQTNEKLNTSVQKQTLTFEKFLAIIGQGGDTAGLGPGLGGVSGGGGGLGGAGVLAPFRAAMGGGGSGGGGAPSIRHGTGGGVNIADPGGRGHVGSWWTPERRQTAIDYLKKNAGLSDVGAQGLVARWAGVEAAQGPGSVNPSSGAVGIAQWLGSRKGGTPADFEGQLAKAARELNTTEARAAGMLRSASTPLEAAVGAAAFERAEGYNPATGADAHVGKTLATMRAMNRGGAAPPADLKDLRLKQGATGGGDAAAGVVDLARYAQSNLPGFNRVTALNDRLHALRRGKHAQGLAFDATIDDPRQSAAAAQQLREHIIAQGLDPSEFKVLDEYRNPSAGATRGHLHAQFESEDAAARYRKATLLQQQQKADKAAAPKLEANGTVRVELSDSLRDKNVKSSTEGLFKDVQTSRGKPMGTAEDYSPLGRAAAGF